MKSVNSKPITLFGINIYRVIGMFVLSLGTAHAADAIFIDSQARVGIDTNSPTAPLHVESQDAMSASILVRNPTAPTAAGDVGMFSLVNTGNKTVRFLVNAGGSTWTFDNEPTFNPGGGVNSGRFRISKVGTGVAEFTVDGNGNGRLNGSSYAVNHINTSSRESKTDFRALDEQEVLSKLMQLPVSEWRYKQEGEDIRHIGPVAEDFQKTFGLGDGKTISTVDSEGIALAAIKAVKLEKDAQFEDLKAENDKLRAEREAQRDQIEILTKRLTALEELLVGKQQVSVR